MHCTAFTYYVTLMNGQTYACLIASSVKIITKRVAVIYRFKSARMVSCCDLYACSWAVICQYSWCYRLSSKYDDRLEDCFVMYRFTLRTTKYVIFYTFCTCNLPIQLLLCVKKRLTTSTI